MDVTKIEGRSLKLNKEKFNLNILISEVLKDYVNKQKDQLTAKIVYDFKRKEDIIVDADRDRLSQVIHNLLDNALKFTTHQQTIFVIVDKKEGQGQVIVSVKDNGEGIPEKILPKLFSKFSVSNSTTGTGLGLYISKNIIEAHDGRIWATDNKEKDREKGVGSTFTFSLSVKQ